MSNISLKMMLICYQLSSNKRTSRDSENSYKLAMVATLSQKEAPRTNEKIKIQTGRISMLTTTKMASPQHTFRINT
jgi:hypothetical protein